ncbi:hypothetical protein MGYG_08893 [Nannizzia gypsea CBS 118893]|uniref:Aminoglycoside phosphotransferase domain-containing protein n=1 Tax=Arthroderma gypseum (strain ATCC MYA-4604 / CBS 118893) TaxID=535722 RepID=E5QZ98_ARTGP|nr:hypothetical protein MGYG_08893 [Nannizzia gypsea CBS 118893]EFQ97330.1 hypothetical protein MGYG_08893 [Nannizzia gypsea CBS 118893]
MEGNPRLESQISLNAKILHGLSPLVVKISRPNALPAEKLSGQNLPTIIQGLSRAIAKSSVMWTRGSTAVLGLSQEIVMKTGCGIDIGHRATSSPTSATWYSWDSPVWGWRDAGRHVLVAEFPIESMAESNQFLTTDPKRAETGRLKMIRSFLSSDHELVMTHGDLHPRNLMVITPTMSHLESSVLG